MANKYLKLNTSTGRPTQQEATVTSGGSGDAGKIIALDAAGKLDITVMPVGIGAETQVVTASEALTAGQFVQVYDNAGTASARKALATDLTKPATGYVVDSAASGSVTVYTDGVNAYIPVGAFVAADVGKQVFLSASVSGAVVLAPPSSAGNLLQKLGKITEVGATYIKVAIDFGDEIEV